MCLLVCLYVPCFIYHTHLAIATHFHIRLRHFSSSMNYLKITTATEGTGAAPGEASGDLAPKVFTAPLAWQQPEAVLSKEGLGTPLPLQRLMTLETFLRTRLARNTESRTQTIWPEKGPVPVQYMLSACCVAMGKSLPLWVSDSPL